MSKINEKTYGGRSLCRDINHEPALPSRSAAPLQTRSVGKLRTGALACFKTMSLNFCVGTEQMPENNTVRKCRPPGSGKKYCTSQTPSLKTTVVVHHLREKHVTGAVLRPETSRFNKCNKFDLVNDR